MIDTCRMLLPLAARHDACHAFLRATTYLVQALNAHKQPHVAMTYIRAAERWVDAKMDVKIAGLTPYIYMVALKAETQLLLNDVRQCAGQSAIAFVHALTHDLLGLQLPRQT